jgi:hypothetical protein
MLIRFIPASCSDQVGIAIKTWIEVYHGCPSRESRLLPHSELSPQHRCELHEFLIPAAPFFGVWNKRVPIADVVRTARGKLLEGGPASLPKGDLLAFLDNMKSTSKATAWR